MIHAQTERFDERNPFLLCLLGLVGVAAALAGALAPGAGAHPGDGGGEPPSEAVQLALLGAASVAASLGAALDASVPLLALEASPRPAHPARTLRGLRA